MSFPSRGEIELVLLVQIESMGGEGHPKYIYSKVTEGFPQITMADLDRKKSDGTSLWENRIAWVRYQLAENGEIDKSVRGMWRITEKGKERLRRHGLLKRELEETAPPISPELRLHQQVQTQLEELGRILGKYAKKEHREAPYIYDVIWKDAEWLPRITHAFEVQDKGNLIEALAKLKHARDSWGSHLFLVVTGQKDRKKLDQILNPYFTGTFHEISTATTVLSPEEVGEIYEFANRFKKPIEQFLAE